MKIITYIYVFALYILCSPGFFFKSKMNITNYIIHGLVFTFLLYFTFGLVNETMLETAAGGFIGELVSGAAAFILGKYLPLPK